MSDALSDIATDERRTRNYDTLLENLLNYLKEPSDESHQQIVEAAKNTDSVGQGFWGGRTDFSNGLEERLQKLREGDKTVWAKTLVEVSTNNNRMYPKFKQLSPFKDQVLLFIDYGCGHHARAKILEFGEDEIAKKIQDENFMTHDCDKYILALPISEDIINQGNVFHIRSGYYPQKPPRDKKGNPKS